MGCRRLGARKWVAALVLATGLLPVFSVRAAPPQASAPVVKTRMGEIRGKLDGTVREFLGIPYAAPPVGDLRWRAPRPPAGWTGALDATKPGNWCAQARLRGQGVAGSEDCLFLNIYAPDTPDQALPVMVWIHGGTFVVGSGAQYDGHELAERGHLIVVTINYRLGPFGFLANRGLDGADPGHLSGNYGLLDQQAALRWVKDNIEPFGGDPGKVTVAGESAGAISIGLHLVSPAAAGLFERAILESGPFLRLPTLADAEMRGDQFAARLECAGAAACMRSKSTEEVLNAIPASPISAGPPVWFPVMDGHLVPSQPADAIAAGHLNKVPVINGSNRDEGTLFAAFGRKALSAQEFTASIQSRFGGNAQRVLAAYPLADYPSPTQASAAGFGDVIFSCRVLKAGELLSAWVPVYQYEFNDPNAPNVFTPNPPFPFGAYHGSEIQYVVGSVLTKNTATPAQRGLAESMMSYWIRFIGTGAPGGTAPKWDRFRADEPRILSLSPGTIDYESNFAKVHHCDLWNSIRP
jgi:para-nitrobenzyl esterase